MLPNEFRKLNTERNRTSSVDKQEPKLALYGLGIAGEAGEVADELKKILFHDKPLDVNNLLVEVGDVLWYIDRLLNYFSLTMSDAMEAVTTKLDKRYPNGFVPHSERTDT